MNNRSWFKASHPQTDHRWGVVLAGGDGTRLQRFIKTRFGEYRPKQYCALIGKRTMFRHTIDRVSPLFAPDHLLTSINAGHTSWASADLHDRLSQTIITQPYNRETGPGILLPLLHVHHADPQAIVALFPSDHFILQEERYRAFVSKAFEFVSKHNNYIVALGIVPSTLQYGYGWIEKGDNLFSEGLWSVRKFWEKPDGRELQHLFEKKCLWNTMTLIGTSLNFLNLCKEHMNEVFVPLNRTVQYFGTSSESDLTDFVFKRILSVNFSSRVLERIPETLCVLQMNGVYWNDWGDESRILKDIDLLEHREQIKTEEEVHLDVEYF
ncbi:MAG: sugar phosphate nucleotidyltransferase [Bacteroidota bacterium]|nr:sugar phosphate nucleotidyltransferase [Bacteroidota bacterium]